MGYFGVHFYNICGLNGEKEFLEFILENWSHILDKCQRPLDKNKLKSQELLETLNSVIEVIQFTMEFSDKKIPLLDILVKRDSSGIFKNFRLAQ